MQWIVSALNSVDKLSVDNQLFQFVYILPERKKNSIQMYAIVDEQSKKTQ